MKAIFLTLFICLFITLESFSQGCVTCTNTAAQLGQDSAKGLNVGILYLAAIPLSLIGVVGIIWYRRNQFHLEED